VIQVTGSGFKRYLYHWLNIINQNSAFTNIHVHGWKACRHHCQTGGDYAMTDANNLLTIELNW